MSRKAEIKLTIDLDGDNLPRAIEWEATDARTDKPVRCESMLLSLWDSAEKIAPSIDLWTQEMTIDDMNLFIHQVLHKLADTYQRSTGNVDVAKVIHEFGDEFGVNLGLTGRGGEATGAKNPAQESIDLVSLASANGRRGGSQ